MATYWENVETKALLAIWGDEKMRSQLDGIARNKTAYPNVAASIAELVYDQALP